MWQFALLARANSNRKTLSLAANNVQISFLFIFSYFFNQICSSLEGLNKATPAHGGEVPATVTGYQGNRATQNKISRLV